MGSLEALVEGLPGANVSGNNVITPSWRLAGTLHAMVGTLVLAFADAYAGPPFFFCESFPDPPGRECFQGWGSDAVGSGPNGTVIHVGQAPSGCNPPPAPTETDLINAILLANTTSNPTIVFPRTRRFISPTAPDRRRSPQAT